MATPIIHGWPVLLDCVVVIVTTIREGCEFEDLVGTPTSQNTIRSTTAFTHPYENPPKTTPPPENPTST
jgi:hypothetical protein